MLLRSHVYYTIYTMHVPLVTVTLNHSYNHNTLWFIYIVSGLPASSSGLAALRRIASRLIQRTPGTLMVMTIPKLILYCWMSLYLATCQPPYSCNKPILVFWLISLFLGTAIMHRMIVRPDAYMHAYRHWLIGVNFDNFLVLLKFIRSNAPMEISTH